jgi:hypothetical protein
VVANREPLNLTQALEETGIDNDDAVVQAETQAGTVRACDRSSCGSTGIDLLDPSGSLKGKPSPNSFRSPVAITGAAT